MALSDLLAALEKDGQQAVARELERGRSEARRLVELATASAVRLTGESLARYEAELQATSERALVAARRDAERAVLQARAALLDRVFQSAESALPQTREWPEYRSAIEADLSDVTQYLPDGCIVVTCSIADRPLVQAAVGRSGEVSVSVGEADMTGIRLTSGDGSIEVDRSLGTRLHASRPALSIELLAELVRDP